MNPNRFPALPVVLTVLVALVALSSCNSTPGGPVAPYEPPVRANESMADGVYPGEALLRAVDYALAGAPR